MTSMRTRRLIVAPIIALVAILLVAAVIESGQRHRLAASSIPSTWQPSSDDLLVERERLDRIERLVTACVGPIECSADGAPARFEAAAEQVLAAPTDPRLTPLRTAVAKQHRAHALLATMELRADADGSRTHEEQSQIETQEQAVERATIDAIDEQHAAGLIDAAGREHLRSEIR